MPRDFGLDFNRFFPSQTRKPFFIDPVDVNRLTPVQRGQLRRLQDADGDWILEARTAEEARRKAAARLRAPLDAIKATGSA